VKVRLHDSLSGETRPLETGEPGLVKVYACGPTVYLPQHVGNFKTFMFEDVLRRTLELAGYRVRLVMNITDVGHMTTDSVADAEGEDKMEVSARREGVAPLEIAERITRRFHEDRKALRILDAAVYCRATEHVPEMIDVIRRLVARGHAYAVGGNVYFEVATFPGYGKLSRNTVAALEAGARVGVNPEKRHPADFALWKTDPKHLQQWDSPWGRGFPGWHIECSAMAVKHLGTPTLDVHCGGEDHLFPHHECEIAQSEGAFGVPFSRFWLHGRFMNVSGRKMAKSAGNFWTLGELRDLGHDPVAVRYHLLSAHYRAQMNFSLEGIAGAAAAVERIRSCLRNLVEDASAPPLAEGERARIAAFEAAYRDALADDLNVSGALGQVHDAVRWANSRGAFDPAGAAAVRALFGVFDAVLDVLREEGGPAAGPTDAAIEALVREREEARKARDFPRADAARKRLAELGVLLEDTPRGPRWTRRPSDGGAGEGGGPA
jgi:cysteinyl-tRNA synthetase